MALVPNPLFLSALAAGVGLRVIDAMRLMFPDKPATVALVLMRRRVVGIRHARKHVEQVLERVTADTARGATGIAPASSPARVAETTQVILFSVF